MMQSVRLVIVPNAEIVISQNIQQSLIQNLTSTLAAVV